MSEVNDIKELHEDTFTITLKLTEEHQQLGSSIIDKNKNWYVQ